VCMYPAHRSKVIHIVHHAHAFHNVECDYVDASLIDMGWQQSQVLHAHLYATRIRDQVELVVVSPLLRTLQTVAAVCGGTTLLDHEAFQADLAPLIVSRLGRAPHAAIAAPKSLRFVANELYQEQWGVHLSSQRSSIDFYKKSFPNVDFSEVKTNEDM
jgi:phosphohistidine phosphatase SixA